MGLGVRWILRRKTLHPLIKVPRVIYVGTVHGVEKGGVLQLQIVKHHHLIIIFPILPTLSPLRPANLSVVPLRVAENLSEEIALIISAGDGGIIINKTIKVY